MFVGDCKFDLHNTNINKLLNKDDIKIDESKYHFWQSETYHKPYIRNKHHDKNFDYFDDITISKYLFFDWVNKWANYSTDSYVEPYKCHPLPIADQILYWQPIFSKHVSDGLVKQEKLDAFSSTSTAYNKKSYHHKSILIRAGILTFWKRTLFGLLGIIATNILSMSISFLVKKLLEMLNHGKFSFVSIFFLLLSIILLQIADGIFIENFNYYLYRLVCIVHYSFSITIFQHALCYRRKYFNNVEGTNTLNVCNNVLHSFSPDSECSKNPLYCPSRRYQNKDITAEILPMEFTDTYYISLFFESLIFIINFLSNFIYGILLMSFQIKINMWVLYVVGLLFVFFMVFVEVVNTYVLKFIYLIRDQKISKCCQIISSLPILYKMLLDDIAINIITQCRNNELYFFLIRMFLTFFNRSLYIICVNISFYVLKRYFVHNINNAEVITEIDTAGFLTTLYIFLKIIDSMFLFPHSVKLIANSTLSYTRLEKYIKNRSPNFYISDNKFTGSLYMSSKTNEVTNQIDKDVMVLYKDATFSWIHSRKEYVDANYHPYLKNVNFELKRGEIAIITGSQGSGKSNFIKSVLGEMTLVGGSMAVVPLHTSMPIFYASQDIWLKKGTIRSNVTFGYKYDELLYNTVLRAVELEYDISTWERGDLRVISDNAHSLSGGQRVRMELARALYAYMIFSQVNKQYNNSQCSFLMCLDSSFNGLDPFVSKTIFNNLFNSKTGLLVKDDLSVIATFSRRSLALCLSASTIYNFPEIPIYNTKIDFFHYYCNLSDFVDFYKNPYDIDYTYFSSSSNDKYSISSFPSDMFMICSSGYNTRLGRRLVTKSKYDHSFTNIIDNFATNYYNPYKIYITAAGLTFVAFLVLTFILAIMDNVKFVLVTNLSDYLTANIELYNDGHLVDMEKMRSRAALYLNIVSGCVLLNIILSLMCSFLFTLSSFLASRKIHEYCIDSICNYDSKLIKLKKHISQIMTYLSCDIFQIDDDLCYDLYLSVVSFVEMFINVCTLFYLVPISIPFVVPTIIFVYKFVLMQFLGSSSNLYLAYLESVAQINSVYENAISGSSVYRSYKKEWEFVNEFIEHTDYKIRCRFLIYSVRAWVPILFNWIFSFTTMMLVIMVVFGKYTNFKMGAGYFGLGLSLCMKVIKTFTKFSFSVANIQIHMCSIKRFQSFIPPGTKCVFKKFINVNEEDLLVNYSSLYDYKIEKKSVLKRRMIEFKFNNRRFRGLKMFFKPQINLLDVTKYIPSEHVGLELRNVYVNTSPEFICKGIILNNINVSASKSDIIGIIGRTGAGKTTLLSVLENTMRNRTGHVLLDGKDLNDIPKNITRQIIGVLPQLPFVFKGWTVRRFLDPRRLFSDNEINEALDNCGLLEFVNRLPGGKKLDSVIIPDDVLLNFLNSNDFDPTAGYVGFESDRSLKVDVLNLFLENDMLISNSQLRTLAFARLVLYRYFYRMIIIDEPPSENCYDDNITKPKVGIPIYELLKRYFKHCTCFITAHDSNVLRLCTSVWVLHSGQLIRTCKREDISANESISNIIEQSIRYQNE